MASSDEEPVLEEEEETKAEEELIKEKRISVDPMSLRHAPPLLKPRFVSVSHPSSATLLPNFSWMSPTQMPGQQKGLTLLSRSKSCGDGRSSQPPDDFDILSRHHNNTFGQPQNTKLPISKSDSRKQDETMCDDRRYKEEEKFKCGALCLFLPGFVKKKQEQAHLQQEVVQEAAPKEEDEEKVVSRVASLEKFECGSWSSAILDYDDEDYEGGGVETYFDLPLELIRGNHDDAHSPVRSAFVFDRGERKGVLKKCTSKSGARKSVESAKQVRFSTSAPESYPPSPSSSCVTPRLWKAREEFNALLEAQNVYINF